MADIIEAAKYSDTEIAQMFSDYVTRMEDMERHTGAAVKEADAFDTYCESEFPRNVRAQNNLYERMMNTAVEYEEGGFISGFKTAMALLSGQEELLPSPTQISKSAVENSQPVAVNASQNGNKAKDTPEGFRKNPPPEANFIEDNDHITSVQISEMFGTSNLKVVRRIEKQILPYYDDNVKSHFIRVEGYNIQHKKCTFYRLDSTACLLYMKEMEPKKSKFVNIAGGYAKMQELMEKMFPAEKLALPA